MEIIMYFFATTLAMIASFAAGMYVVTQIKDWINKNIK